ncbi:hypothetical protein [Streptosporangium amethystogenes]|uniref:hypothetical protein n=1 Tax=Streptosporangium amethystogenes TaxID=2002 RepID=UPI0004CB15EB|nr:hypothetical protein [Streptosporangium amethystogenes]
MSTNDVGVLWLEAATRDGVTITVNAVAQALLTDPAACASYPGSPGAAMLAAAEAEIRRYVGERDLSRLSRCVDLAGDAYDGACHWGVEVTLVALTRVEVRLQEDLIRWAERLAS